MIKNSLKFLTILSFVGLITGLCVWLVVKVVVTEIAKEKAQDIIASAYTAMPHETADEQVIALATEIFKNFEQIDPAHVFAYKLRPYLTNKRLPGVLRLQEGVMETLLNKGLCDNASRLLSFVLRQEAFKARQWDMVTPGGGHAATLVTLPDERNVYVDSLFGVAAMDKNGHLIHPEEALSLIREGKKPEDIFYALGQKTEYKFYHNFSKVSMAADNDSLIIEAIIPNFSEENLVLGKIDGDFLDVRSALTKNKIGTVYNYVGHRYNRNWVRILRADEPVQVTFILTDDVENGVITSEPKPQISGKKMTWNLKTGEEIRFYDSRAKISWRRLNSYIDIDQIIFKRM